MRGVPGTRNIIKQKDGFYIRKFLNGKHTYLGYGSTLIIALMRRDWCIVNNWKPYPVEHSYVQKVDHGYHVRKWNGEKMECLGFFKTLHEAENEIKLLKKCDWDIEILCNYDERKDDKTIFLGREMYE